MNKFLGSLVAAVTIAFTTPVARAASIDLDVMFVIDQTPSMSDELSALSQNIHFFVNGLANNANVSSLGIGLVTYEEASQGGDGAGTNCSPGQMACLTLRQSISTSSDLTNLRNELTEAANNVFGGIADGLSAVDSLLPGGSLFGSGGWRDGTVKSVVLVTDKASSDIGTYAYDGLSGAAGLGKKLDDVKYFNYTITSSTLFSDYQHMANPNGPLFSLADFNGWPQMFLTSFAAYKLGTVADSGVATGGSPGVVPLPAAGWLMLAGLGSLLAMRRRKAA